MQDNEHEQTLSGDCVHLNMYIYIYFFFCKGTHVDCHSDSACKRPNYTPSKTILTDQKAIEAFEKSLKITNIYRNAESYCRVSVCSQY